MPNWTAEEEAEQELKSIIQHASLARIEAKIKEEADALVDNAAEIKCLREVKDIINELKSVLCVAEEQRSLIREFDGSRGPNSETSPSFLYGRIVMRCRDIEAMIKSAKRVEDSVSFETAAFRFPPLN